MKKNIKPLLLSLCACVALSALLGFYGCSAGQGEEGSSDTSEAVSLSDDDGVSSAEPEVFPVDRAVEIRVEDKKDEEVFLLGYIWGGTAYSSPDSLQKTMMSKYAPKGSYAPLAAYGDEVSLVFDSEVGAPSEILVTQIANTVRTNSGMAFDVVEPELQYDGEYIYSFHVDFRDFVMYYYSLDCKWDNGDEVHYGFALERKDAYRPK